MITLMRMLDLMVGRLIEVIATKEENWRRRFIAECAYNLKGQVYRIDSPAKRNLLADVPMKTTDIF